MTPVVVVGMGEMGGVFARAFLSAGHPVHPVLRRTPPRDVAAAVPAPALALVAVGEADLHPVLDELPDSWRSRVGLVQNELLPPDWQRHGLEDATVAAVWFEKKAGRPVKVIIPTPVFGPGAELVVDALERIGIPARELDSAAALLHELVAKNLYILVANIGGLVSGGTVAHLWEEHHDLAAAVADDVLALQEALAGSSLPRTELLAALEAAFEADREHGAMGRSAPARLERARSQARELGVPVPALNDVAARVAG